MERNPITWERIKGQKDKETGKKIKGKEQIKGKKIKGFGGGHLLYSSLFSIPASLSYRNEN
jgi:hypothetical protein